MVKKDISLSLEGKSLNGYLLQVQNLTLGRFPEETNFVVFLKAKDGTISKNAVVKGKYFAGRGKFYKPWLEINYYCVVQFNSSYVRCTYFDNSEYNFLRRCLYCSFNSSIKLVPYRRYRGFSISLRISSLQTVLVSGCTSTRT